MKRPAIALGLALAACGPPAMPPSAGHPLDGADAPAFNELSTSSWDVGIPGPPNVKVTVIDFWASWCDECTRTLPSLDALYRDKKDDGVMVIGVNVDENANDPTLGDRASFPIVLDPRMKIASRYRVGQIPTSFVVDARGKVRFIGRDPDEIKQAVNATLHER